MSKLRKTIGFILASLLCAILAYFLLVTVFPPRVFLSPLYILGVLCGTGVFLFALEFVSPTLVRKIERSSLVQSVRHWTKRKKVVSVVLIAVVFVALIPVKPIVDNIHDKKFLEAAKQQFLPIAYGVISQAKIDRTLVELQKTLDELRGEYVEEPTDYVIKVHLFSDRNELIQKTGMSEWSAGGTLTLPGRPPELAIPVEKESSVWNNTLATSTPSHEIAHVVTFEAMNLKDMELIPRFFDEGMANYESLKDLNRFPNRLFNRITLVTYKSQLANLATIPTLNIKDSSANEEDIALFYRLSEEFIRYLVHNYGERTPWYVVQDVGNGMGFYEAFNREYKREYFTAFSEFLEYFY